MVIAVGSQSGSSLAVWSRFHRADRVGGRDALDAFEGRGADKNEICGSPEESDDALEADRKRAEEILSAIPIERLDRIASRTQMPAWMAAEDTSGL